MMLAQDLDGRVVERNGLLLRSGRWRGFSIRKRQPPLLVGFQVTCPICGLTFTEWNTDAWRQTVHWLWVSFLGFCPECGTRNLLGEGYLAEKVKAS